MLSVLPFRTKDDALCSLGITSLAVTTILQIWMFSTSQTASVPAYSINPCFLYLAFLGQTILQFWWLTRTPHYSTLAASDAEPIKEDVEPLLESSAAPTREVPHISHELWDIPIYMPYYISGNICISVWVTACHHQRISLAQFALFVAIILQLRVILSTFSSVYRRTSVRSSSMTLFVSKISLGVLVMYLWRTWGLIDHFLISPTFEQRVHSGVVFVLLTVATGPDPTVGLTFIYVLLSLYFGSYQNSGWHVFFLIESAVLAALLVVDSLIIRLGNTENAQAVSDIPLSAEEVSNFTDNEDNIALFSSSDSESGKDVIPMLPLYQQHVAL